MFLLTIEQVSLDWKRSLILYVVHCGKNFGTKISVAARSQLDNSETPYVAQVQTPTHVRVAYTHTRTHTEVHTRTRVGVPRSRKYPSDRGEHRPSCLRKKTGLDFVSEIARACWRKRRRASGNLIRQNTRPCSPYLLRCLPWESFTPEIRLPHSATVLRSRAKFERSSSVSNESKLDFGTA